MESIPFALSFGDAEQMEAEALKVRRNLNKKIPVRNGLLFHFSSATLGERNPRGTITERANLNKKIPHGKYLLH